MATYESTLHPDLLSQKCKHSAYPFINSNPNLINQKDHFKELLSELISDDSVSANLESTDKGLCCEINKGAHLATEPLKKYWSTLFLEHNTCKNLVEKLFSLFQFYRLLIITENREESNEVRILMKELQDYSGSSPTPHPCFINFPKFPNYNPFTAHITNGPINEDPISHISIPRILIHKLDSVEPAYETVEFLPHFITLVSLPFIGKFHSEWQQILVNQLFSQGKWGIIGSHHHLIFPLLLDYKFQENPPSSSWVNQEILAYCTVINKDGIFIGHKVLHILFFWIACTWKMLNDTTWGLSFGIIKFLSFADEEFRALETASQKVLYSILVFQYLRISLVILSVQFPFSCTLSRIYKIDQFYKEGQRCLIKIFKCAKFLAKRIPDFILNSTLQYHTKFGQNNCNKWLDWCKTNDNLFYFKASEPLFLLFRFFQLTLTFFRFNMYMLDCKRFHLIPNELECKLFLACVKFLKQWLLCFLSEEDFQINSPIITVHRFCKSRKLYEKSKVNAFLEFQDADKTRSWALSVQMLDPVLFQTIFYFSSFACTFFPKRIANEFLSIPEKKYVEMGEIFKNLCRDLLSATNKLALNKLLALNNIADMNLNENKSNTPDCIPVFPLVFWQPPFGSSLDDILNLVERTLEFVSEFEPNVCTSLRDSHLFLVNSANEILFQIVAAIGNLIQSIGYEKEVEHNRIFENKSSIYFKVNSLLYHTETVFTQLSRCRHLYSSEKLQMNPFLWPNSLKELLSLLWDTAPAISETLKSCKILRNLDLVKRPETRSGIIGIMKFEGYIPGNAPHRLEQYVTCSFDEPLPDSLHMQIPLLVFSLGGFSKCFKDLQDFAWLNHPLGGPVGWRPEAFTSENLSRKLEILANTSNSGTRTYRIASTTQLDFQQRNRESSVNLLGMIGSVADINRESSHLPSILLVNPLYLYELPNTRKPSSVSHSLSQSSRSSSWGSLSANIEQLSFSYEQE